MATKIENPLPKRGILGLPEADEFCDLQVKSIDGNLFPALKWSLSQQSDVLKREIEQNREPLITIECIGSRHLSLVLDYLHFGSIELSKTFVPHIYFFSFKYHVESLRQCCLQYIEKNLDTDLAIVLFQYLESDDLKSHRERILQLVNKNLSLIVKPESIALLNKPLLSYFFSLHSPLFPEKVFLDLILNYADYLLEDSVEIPSSDSVNQMLSEFLQKIVWSQIPTTYSHPFITKFPNPQIQKYIQSSGAQSPLEISIHYEFYDAIQLIPETHTLCERGLQYLLEFIDQPSYKEIMIKSHTIRSCAIQLTTLPPLNLENLIVDFLRHFTEAQITSDILISSSLDEHLILLAIPLEGILKEIVPLFLNFLVYPFSKEQESSILKYNMPTFLLRYADSNMGEIGDHAMIVLDLVLKDEEICQSIDSDLLLIISSLLGRESDMLKLFCLRCLTNIAAIDDQREILADLKILYFVNTNFTNTFSGIQEILPLVVKNICFNCPRSQQHLCNCDRLASFLNLVYSDNNVTQRNLLSCLVNIIQIMEIRSFLTQDYVGFIIKLCVSYDALVSPLAHTVLLKISFFSELRPYIYQNGGLETIIISINKGDETISERALITLTNLLQDNRSRGDFFNVSGCETIFSLDLTSNLSLMEGVLSSFTNLVYNDRKNQELFLNRGGLKILNSALTQTEPRILYYAFAVLTNLCADMESIQTHVISSKTMGTILEMLPTLSESLLSYGLSFLTNFYLVPKQFKDVILTPHFVSVLMSLCDTDNSNVIRGVARCLNALLTNNYSPEIAGAIVASRQFPSLITIFSTAHISAIMDVLMFLQLILPGNPCLIDCFSHSNFLSQIISLLDNHSEAVILKSLQLLNSICEDPRVVEMIRSLPLNESLKQLLLNSKNPQIKSASSTLLKKVLPNGANCLIV